MRRPRSSRTTPTTHRLKIQLKFFKSIKSSGTSVSAITIPTTAGGTRGSGAGIRRADCHSSKKLSDFRTGKRFAALAGDEGRETSCFCCNSWRQRNLSTLIACLLLRKNQHSPWGPHKNFVQSKLIERCQKSTSLTLEHEPELTQIRELDIFPTSQIKELLDDDFLRVA